MYSNQYFGKDNTNSVTEAHRSKWLGKRARARIVWSMIKLAILVVSRERAVDRVGSPFRSAREPCAFIIHPVVSSSTHEPLLNIEQYSGCPPQRNPVAW